MARTKRPLDFALPAEQAAHPDHQPISAEEESSDASGECAEAQHHVDATASSSDTGRAIDSSQTPHAGASRPTV